MKRLGVSSCSVKQGPNSRQYRSVAGVKELLTILVRRKMRSVVRQAALVVPQQ